MARRTYLFKTFTCPDGHDTKKFVEAAEVAVMCAEAGCALAGVLPEVLESVFSVHGDALDYIDHNLGRHPVHITSKAQRRALMAAAGLEEFIRHTPVPGTDKSPFTIRWVTMDEKTLRNAQELVLRQAGVAPEPEPEPAPVANPFSYEPTTEQMTDLTKVFNDASAPTR